jgi:hypothetical protein
MSEMQFFQLFLIVSGLVALCVLGLALRILFVKGGRFPETHIENNPGMKKLGIRCAQHDNQLCQGLTDSKSREQICSGTGSESCANCSLLKDS